MNLAKYGLKILIIPSLVLLTALGLGIYQLFYANLHAPESFSRSSNFAWSPLYQEIVNGTLWINVTWTWQTENLSMTVKVNDDDLHYLDYVGIAFDRNYNGVIESLGKDGGALGFFPYNQYWGGLLGPLGGISFASGGLSPSKYHTCTFTNETGYEFRISLPKTLFTIDHPILMHLCYRDGKCSEVGYPESYHVFIEFEV